MSITPLPTLTQRMTALHSRMVAVAEAFAEQGDVSAATAVKAQAKQIKQELAAFDRDLVAALTENKVDPKTAIAETDLYAGHREPTTAAEAEEARVLASSLHAPRKVPPGTWGWLSLPGKTVRRRAYTSSEGGEPVYIDEGGTRWFKSSIDQCTRPGYAFEPDSRAMPPAAMKQDPALCVHVWNECTKGSCICRVCGIEKPECEVLSDELAATKSALKQYHDAVDNQPWATDEPIRVQLNRITKRLADAEPYKQWYVDLTNEILGERPEGENECPFPIVIVRDLKRRCQLLNWINMHVDKIDFIVKVPPSVFTSNPWIAYGHNFESAVTKARDALTKATS